MRPFMVETFLCCPDRTKTFGTWVRDGEEGCDIPRTRSLRLLHKSYPLGTKLSAWRVLSVFALDG